MDKFTGRILITGVTGFVGSHMVEYIQREHPKAVIYGTVRPRSDRKNISQEMIQKGLKLIECDLEDFYSVDTMMGMTRPDLIFHLAAQSDVSYSFKNAGVTLKTNVIGQLNLLEGMIAHARDARIHIAGSSEEYGAVRPEEFPIKENQALRPLSPYAVSKVAQEALALQYARSYDLWVVITRAFNHTGPRRGDNFAESSWAKQLAEGNTVKHGNLDSNRDYTDVRDMVHAYWLAITRGKSGEVYNICSGKTHSMRYVLERLTKISRKKNVEFIQDRARMRPSDLVYLLGDNTKFKIVTGWEPKIPFEETLLDLYTYWFDKTF